MLFFKKIFKKKIQKEEKQSEKKIEEKQEAKQKLQKVEKKIEPHSKVASVQKKKIADKSKISEVKVGPKYINIAQSVLVRPVITEKATFSETKGVYIFEIFIKANKISVKKAIKELYNVDPIKVNIIRTKGKKVRYGRISGRTKDRKKAMVFLKKGQKIEFVKK